MLRYALVTLAFFPILVGQINKYRVIITDNVKASFYLLYQCSKQKFTAYNKLFQKITITKLCARVLVYSIDKPICITNMLHLNYIHTE